MPDTANVFIRMRKVGVFPIHPLAQPFGLLRDNAGKPLNTLHALARELVHPVSFNVFFRLEAELFFHFHLNPQPLCVETVLIAAIIALHAFIADERILQRPAPGMMDPHRIIRSNRPVKKTEHLMPMVFFTQLVEAIILLPKPHDAVLQIDEAVFF